MASPDTPHRVLIKRPLPHLSDSPGVSQELLYEFHLLRQLRHGQITRVLDLVKSDQFPFLVFEYIDGTNLEELLLVVTKAGNTIPEEMALYIAAATANVLSYIHDARTIDGTPLGVVHRDIKPSNLFISSAGEVILLDFGCASGHHQRERTGVGIVKGTFSYMAPEQVDGGVMDRRTDIWALGRLLHEMFFPQAEPLTSIISSNASFEVNPALAPDIAQIVRRATQRQKRNRFQNAQEMLKACWKGLTKRSHEAPQVLLRKWLSTLERRPSKQSPIVNKTTAQEENLLRGLTDRNGDSGFFGRTQLINAFFTPTPSDPGERTGTGFFGYRLEACVSRHPSWIFRATRKDPAETVAIQITPTPWQNAAQRDLVLGLAKQSAVLGGVNILALLKYGSTDDNRMYFISRWADGPSLASVIEQEAPFPAQRVYHLARQLAQMVCTIHRAGFLHGTFHPSKLYLCRQRHRERLMRRAFDFDEIPFSLLMGDATKNAPKSNQREATSPYAAPELQNDFLISPSSDLYSIGAVLFAMLTGRAPSGESGESGESHQRLISSKLETLPALATILNKLLAPDPDHRFQSGDDLLRDLSTIKALESEATTQYE